MKRLFVIFVLTGSALAADLSENIRINQIGFYLNGPKLAAVIDAVQKEFYVMSTDLVDTLYTGELSEPKLWPHSEEMVSIADFTNFKDIGVFRIMVPETGYSYPFDIAHNVFQRPAGSALKGYYYQRMSIELEEQYAGKWKRKMGHPDDKVYVHESAATELRPKDTIISCPRGWYDAGDYNKYIVNSGISTYQLLAAWEQFPEYCDRFAINIPESGNSVPDILDEALWNIRWMLTMQDPNDGGVYHKCTCTNFQGFVMPHQATARRYVVQKSTTATFDFCAVMAQASRILKNYSDTFPGLADSCLNAAIRAWQWGNSYPDSIYSQSRMNEKFNPDVSTGEYGDRNPGDEYDWAAIELYITTKTGAFLNNVDVLTTSSTSVPSWPNVATLGLYSLACHIDDLTEAVDTEALRRRLVNWAQQLRLDVENSAYHIVMGKSTNDFGWGSNAVAANQAMGLLVAFQLSADSTFLWDAIHNMDYLLGRNAVGYCFLTGNGSKPPLHIHHRQSGSDGIKDPVPGLLSGGPNPGQQDKSSVTYPSDLPAKSWVDDQGSWASNEICINWNSPFVYAALGIDAYMSKDGGPDVSVSKQDRNKVPSGIRLYPNYPNPFNSSTSIDFEILKSGHVSVTVYNNLGRLVATLHDGFLSPGRYKIYWNGYDFHGIQVTSGIYMLSVQGDGQGKFNQKMLYLR